MAAKLVEVLFSLAKRDWNTLHSYFLNSKVMINNFTRGLIKFYHDIEHTGDSMQFYTKFHYRHYANTLF